MSTVTQTRRQLPANRPGACPPSLARRALAAEEGLQAAPPGRPNRPCCPRSPGWRWRAIPGGRSPGGWACPAGPSRAGFRNCGKNWPPARRKTPPNSCPSRSPDWSWPIARRWRPAPPLADKEVTIETPGDDGRGAEDRRAEGNPERDRPPCWAKSSTPPRRCTPSGKDNSTPGGKPRQPRATASAVNGRGTAGTAETR